MKANGAVSGRDSKRLSGSGARSRITEIGLK